MTTHIRKTRSDSGLIRLMDRDSLMLKFIAQQYTIRLDQLQRLIKCSEPPEKISKDPSSVSESTARQWMTRMRTAGYLQFAAPFRNQTSYMWVTPRGLRFLELPYASWDLDYTRVGRLTHLYWITNLRLDVNTISPYTQWESERAIRYRCEQARTDPKQKIGHIPDGFSFQETSDGYLHDITAIEVELSPKTKQRTLEIMEELLLIPRLETIEYFCTPETFNVVTQARDQLIQKNNQVNNRVFVSPLKRITENLDYKVPLKTRPQAKPSEPTISKK